MKSFFMFLGNILIAAAIAYLGFCIYNFTDRVVPVILKTNEKMDQVVNEVEKLKQELPALAYQAGKEASKGAEDQKNKDIVRKAAERGLSPDPQKPLDPPLGASEKK